MRRYSDARGSTSGSVFMSWSMGVERKKPAMPTNTPITALKPMEQWTQRSIPWASRWP